MDMDMGDTGKRNAKKDTQSNGEGGDSTVRLEQFEVEAGSKYRFRLINGAATWAFRVSIESHSLQLVGLDGADVNATAAVDKVIVNIGERCDLVVHADQPVRNYWIFIESLNGKHISHAILHYTGAETKTLITKQQTMSSSSSSLTYAVDPAPASPLPTKKAVTFDPSVYPNIVTPYPPPGPLPPSSPLASYPPSPVVPATSDYTHTLNLGGNMDTYVWSINGQSFKYPTTPFIFSKGSFDTHSSTQVIDIELNSVIDLVINNPTMMIHPMHLHGTAPGDVCVSISVCQSVM